LRFFIFFLFFGGIGGTSAFASSIFRLVQLEFWTAAPWSSWEIYVTIVLGIVCTQTIGLIFFSIGVCANALLGETFKQQHLQAERNQHYTQTCGKKSPRIILFSICKSFMFTTVCRIDLGMSSLHLCRPWQVLPSRLLHSSAVLARFCPRVSAAYF
jgi:small-conductance mechanosensitive channel